MTVEPKRYHRNPDYVIPPQDPEFTTGPRWVGLIFMIGIAVLLLGLLAFARWALS
jgi:hypothetical protein